MAEFRGQKAPSKRRYDKVDLYLIKDIEEVVIYTFDAEHNASSGAAFDAKTARKIAAELIRLADTIEGTTK